MKRFWYLQIVLVLLAATGCASKGQDVQALVNTMVAQTAAAASPTPAPTSTPTPVPTAPPTPTPPPASPTPSPTSSPTPAPTTFYYNDKGLLAFEDDFSVQTDAWSGCPDCVWKDGKLTMGPYKPGVDNDFHTIICDACGERPYYRLAADVTFTEGYGDRGFGLLISQTSSEIMDLEITTFQTSVLWDYDLATKQWTRLRTKPDVVFNGSVKAGEATNRLEIVAESAYKEGTTDYLVKINGRTTAILYGKPSQSGKVGLVVGWHTIGVAFDNFEYEELESITH